MKSTKHRKLALGACFALFIAANVGAEVVYTMPSGLSPNGLAPGPLSLGLDFTVNTGGYVTDLGLYNATGGSLGAETYPVAIFRTSDAALMVSTGFSGSDWTSTSGSAVLKSVVDGGHPNGVFLAPGTYSVVAAAFGTGQLPYYVAPSTTSSAVGFDSVGGSLSFIGEPRAAGYTGVLTLPAPAGVTYDAPAFAAGTFVFTPVPEPEHFALAGLGLLGLVYVGRNVWMRRQVAV